MVNKGRIPRELGNFFKISSNLIKLDDEMVIEMVMKCLFSILRKRTQRRIHGIKNN